jgi:beta-lactamase regulating signal transducer with metallopeptidase domain
MVPDRLVQSLGAVATVTLVRGALVFAVAVGATLLAHRMRPEARHIVWFAVLASFLLIPLGWLVLPGIPVGSWLPRASASGLGVAAAPALSRAEYARLVERTVAETTRALNPHQPPTLAILAALACAWAAGSLLLAARLVAGAVRLRQLAARAASDPGLQSEADALARELGMRAGFRVLASPRCRIPFTFAPARPLVMLPPEAGAWDAGRRQAVLVHELWHIRRRDVLVNSFAYAVCVAMWFFPPAWLAYCALLREAEAACDQKVIDRGISGPAYARSILELVRSCRGRPLLPSMTTALAGPEMIKQRIRSVLALRPGRRPFRPWHAAVVAAVALCCLVPALAVFAAAASPGLPADDPFFGTWLNDESEVRGSVSGCTMVIGPDGHWFEYRHAPDEQPLHEGWMTVEKAWREAGAHWYRAKVVGWAYPLKSGKTERFSLLRVSADGGTRECVWAQYGYPDRVDSLGPGYRVMHRRE